MPTTTQSIIVYRNPAEQAFWESGMAFPLLCSLFAIVVTFLLVVTISEKVISHTKLRHNRKSADVIITFAIVACAAAAYFTFTYMAI